MVRHLVFVAVAPVVFGAASCTCFAPPASGQRDGGSSDAGATSQNADGSADAGFFDAGADGGRDGGEAKAPLGVFTDDLRMSAFAIASDDVGRIFIAWSRSSDFNSPDPEPDVRITANDGDAGWRSPHGFIDPVRPRAAQRFRLGSLVLAARGAGEAAVAWVETIEYADGGSANFVRVAHTAPTGGWLEAEVINDDRAQPLVKVSIAYDDDGHLVALWQVSNQLQAEEIILTRTRRGSAGWGPTLEVARPLPYTDRQFASLSVAGSQQLVTWSGNNSVYAASPLDDGGWSTVTVIDGAGSLTAPTELIGAAVDQTGRAALLWSEAHSLRLSQRIDGGWQYRASLSPAAPGVFAIAPRLALDRTGHATIFYHSVDYTTASEPRREVRLYQVDLRSAGDPTAIYVDAGVILTNLLFSYWPFAVNRDGAGIAGWSREDPSAYVPKLVFGLFDSSGHIDVRETEFDSIYALGAVTPDNVRWVVMSGYPRNDGGIQPPLAVPFR